MRGSRRAFQLASVPRLLATTASLALVLLAGALLFPTTPDAAYAEETGTKATLVVHPMLSVELQSAVNLDVVPTQDGAFSSSAATLSVSTNNETGYSLYLSTANGKSTLASLNPSVTDTIGAVTGTVSEDRFGDNTWGYNLSKGTPSGNLTYQAVPGGSTVQQGFGSEGPTASDTYTLTFGTKVNTSLPSGTYSNQVVVSVVANPAYVPTLSSIDNMQEMTSEICAASTENETKRLTDTRDGKQYWVAKLADGNCWMTQSLDLDLSTSKALTPDDSDVSRSWTPANNTLTDGTKTTTDNTAVWSWNLGDYVLTTPNAGTNCGYSGISNFGDCTSVGFQSVAGMTPMTDGNATDVISGNTYNAHYHVGNHYTWNAATAGTGGTIISTNATDSICPKGWRLPTSTSSGEYQALVNAYNISSNTDGSTALVSAPLYFVRSGYVYSGSLRDAGYEGDYWSSTADSNIIDAYYFYFRSGFVNPSIDYSRYYGQSVRCLAR